VSIRSLSRVAVVGFGYWGSKHVRVLSSIPRIEVTIVDQDPARLEEAGARNASARLARSLTQVLDDVDAVVVATPPSSHAAIGLDALRAGKPALIEKPLATSLAEAEALVAAADAAAVQLMVAHTFEYNAAVWKLKDIIRSGAIGRLLYLDAARLSLGRFQSDCNVVWDLAAHDISVLSYLLDEVPSSVSVWAHRNISPRHADVAYLRLEFPQAATHAFVHVSWLNPNKVRQITAVGERKMVVYDDMSDNERIRIYDIGVDPAEIDDPSGAHGLPVTYRTGDINSPYINFVEPLLVQDEHFVNSVRRGLATSTPGRRGLDIVRVLAATDAAQATGGRAAVPDLGDRCDADALAGVGTLS